IFLFVRNIQHGLPQLLKLLTQAVSNQIGHQQSHPEKSGETNNHQPFSVRLNGRYFPVEYLNIKGLTDHIRHTLYLRQHNSPHSDVDQRYKTKGHENVAEKV